MQDEKDKLLDNIMKRLEHIDYISSDDIPNIDLYMDQLTTFMDKHLKSAKRYEDDKILTKTMINNYTKNELMPPPIKKKYSKEHLYLLIYIYYLKNILSINDIQSVLNPLTEDFFKGAGSRDFESIYKDILRLEKEHFDSLKKDVILKYETVKKTFANENEEDFLTTFALICTLGFDIYIKKQIIEQIIDNTLKPSEETTDKKEKVEKTIEKN